MVEPPLGQVSPGHWPSGGKAAMMMVSHGRSGCPSIANVTCFLVGRSSNAWASWWYLAGVRQAGRICSPKPFPMACPSVHTCLLLAWQWVPPRGSFRVGSWPLDASPEVCVSCWQAAGTGWWNVGGTRAARMALGLGPGNAVGSENLLLGLSARWPDSQMVPVWHAFGTEVGTAGLGRSESCS